jgi:hypothetical protein
MRQLWLLMAVWVLPVAASDFGARYPAGSIRDAEQAQAVLKEADAEMTRIGQSAKERDAECLRKFLVNSCRDDVRREKQLAEREVRRVRVEAHDLQRRIDAEKVAKQRADKAAALAAEEAKRVREPQVKRSDSVAVKEGSPASASRAQNAEPQGPQPGQEKLTAAERAENARKFQQKQEQAQKRAQEMEVERKENEQRRIEKRKQIEEREAERETIRKKAAESIK